jgi:hypothetical protein
MYLRVTASAEGDDVSSDVVSSLGAEENVMKVRNAGDAAGRTLVVLERKKAQ